MKKIISILKQKWAEYLLEIVVIVISILGAFMLNNWNEDRKNHNLEQAYIANINKEFRANRDEFENLQVQRKAILDICVNLESKKPITGDNWDTIKDDFFEIIRAITFDASQSSIESLINSSSLNIISNAELRNLLIKWPTMIKDYQEEEAWMTESVGECIDWLNYHTDRSDRSLLETDNIIVFQNLLQTSCFLNNLLVNGNSRGRSENKEIQETIDRIISLTDFKN